MISFECIYHHNVSATYLYLYKSLGMAEVDPTGDGAGNVVSDKDVGGDGNGDIISDEDVEDLEDVLLGESPSEPITNGTA